jgi:hypothetical protein
MTPTPTLYSIAPALGGSAGITVTPTWTQVGDGPLAPDYTHLAALPLNGSTLLLAVAPGGAATAFSVDDDGAGLTAVGPPFDLGADFDIVEAFLLGNATYLLGYTAETGEMKIFSLSGDLTLGSPPYSFTRTRAPGFSRNLTVCKPIVVRGLVHVLGYSMTSGAVNAYSLAVTATSRQGAPAGSPALLLTPVWDHQWARNWTHFAFFTLGAECFFFKINTGRLNVNIDHVLDTPSLGTAEVGTYLQQQLPDASELAVVRSFTLAGDPYFLTYKSDGTTIVRRFRGDCLGWSQQAALTAAAEARHVVALGASDEQVYALFC